MKQRYRYKDSEKFAGAIKKDKHVLAIDREHNWKLAQILEVRYEVPYTEEAVFWDPVSGEGIVVGNVALESGNLPVVSGQGI